MRGKKDTLFDEMQYLMSQREAEERLQNERRLLGDFARQYEQFEQTPIDHGGGGSASKRAPSSGFFGMRGKKLSADDDADEMMDEEQKRAGPQGFVGMRGKKWTDGAFDDDGVYGEELNKRAPSLGFHGIVAC